MLVLATVVSSTKQKLEKADFLHPLAEAQGTSNVEVVWHLTKNDQDYA
jgi:hypothetical protein